MSEALVPGFDATAAKFPKMTGEIDRLLAVSWPWYQRLWASAPAIAEVVGTVPTLAASPILALLRVPSIGFRLVHPIQEYQRIGRARVAAKLLRDIVAQLIVNERFCLRPLPLGAYLRGQPAATVVRLTQAEELYRVLDAIIRLPSVRAAAAEDGFSDFARPVQELEAMLGDLPCTHDEADVDDGAVLAQVLHSAMSAAFSDVPFLVDSSSDPLARTLAVQKGVLDLVSQMFASLFPRLVTPDLGANFMLRIPRTDPAFESALASAPEASRDIYGRYLQDCPSLLRVGQTTANSREFAGFVVPYYDASEKDYCLPGAPLAAHSGKPQYFVAEQAWLTGRAPDGSSRWPDAFDQRSMKRLVEHFNKVKFKCCLSVPVHDQTGRLVGVVNANSTSLPADFTDEMLARAADILKPLLLLLGWTQTLAEARQQPQVGLEA